MTHDSLMLPGGAAFRLTKQEAKGCADHWSAYHGHKFYVYDAGITVGSKNDSERYSITDNKELAETV